MSRNQWMFLPVMIALFVVAFFTILALAWTATKIQIAFFPQPPATATNMNAVNQQFATMICQQQILNWKILLANYPDDAYTISHARQDATIGQSSLGDLCAEVGINAMDEIFPTSTALLPSNPSDIRYIDMKPAPNQ
jgi:hypothetical protein